MYIWEEETRKYLSEIQTELNAAKQQLDSAKARVDKLTHEAEAYETALQTYLRRSGKGDNVKQDIRDLLLQQKNHEDRIKRIAEQNNGVIKVGAAADILYNCRLIKSKSRMNAYRIVYGLLIGMVEEGNFQKVGPGEFRLTGTQTRLGSLN
jgi:hypothetical protein